VVIRTVDGREAWQGPAAAASPAAASALTAVEVPAAALARDDYVVTLFEPDGRGGERERYRYVLRIRRPLAEPKGDPERRRRPAKAGHYVLWCTYCGLRAGDFRGLAGLAVRIHHERRRLVADHVLELTSELLDRDADGGRHLGERVRILEIVAAQPDHVAAGD